MNTQHTPGPWTANQSYRNCGYQEYAVNITAPPTDRATKRGFPNQCTARAHGYTKSEAEDNARLIAAAPELLEACKFALDWLGRISATSNGTDIMLANAPNGQHRNMGELRAAIAKAEQPRLTQPQPTKEN